jgi:hypothetical protein
MKAFREKLGLYDVPFLLGGLGDFLSNHPEKPYLKNYPIINSALKRVVEKDPMMGFVSAEGLGDKGDNLHFSAPALREFGLRYYDEFLKLENKDKVFEEKVCLDLAIRTELEHL